MTSVDADLRNGRRLETGRRSESIIYTDLSGVAGKCQKSDGKEFMANIQLKKLIKENVIANFKRTK